MPVLPRIRSAPTSVTHEPRRLHRGHLTIDKSYARKGSSPSRTGRLQGRDTARTEEGPVCVASDCGEKIQTCLDGGEDQQAVVRFSMGYVIYGKRGTVFEPSNILFADGGKYRFAHGGCTYDHGIVVSRLRMDKCMLPRCGAEQFYCARDSKELCLHIEMGCFVPGKRGELYKFKGEAEAAVHWPCARDEWDWEFTETLLKSNISSKCPR